MRILLSLLAGALCASISTVAPAQDAPSGSPARNAQDVFDVRNKESDYFENTFRKSPKVAAEVYARTLNFASCLTQADTGAAASVLDADAGSKDEARAIQHMSRRYSRCIPRRETVAPIMIRGALAETMWKQAGANPNPTNRTSVDVADVENFIKMSPRGESATKAGNLPLYWVSRCQVMALPDQSAKVLAAAPGSDAERKEAATLYANSKLCGVENGLGDLSVAAARAGLAEALYRNMKVTTFSR